jgi:Tol biopolymer transport system component
MMRMKLMAILIFGLLCADLRSFQAAAQGAGKPDATTGTQTAPRLFGDGVISTPDHEGNASVSPDGRTLYFTRFAPFDTSFSAILFSQMQKGGRWGEPQLAAFSNPGTDSAPFISPDGSRIFFASFRASEGSRKADTDLWMVERRAGAWGEPKNLGAQVNSDAFELSPTVTASGTLYFWSTREGGKGGADIYRARQAGGVYGTPENLGEAINAASNETDLFVAPDESYMIFASDRPGGEGRGDLYISYNQGGAWTQPRNLGKAVNTVAGESGPYVTPDGTQLLFVSTKGAGDATPEKPLTYAELQRLLKSVHNGRRNIYAVGTEVLKSQAKP